MEYRPPLHFGVVAIEKGAFESSLTKVDNFTSKQDSTMFLFHAMY